MVDAANVVYFLCGKGYIGMITVSAWSLRKHYHGQAMIAAADEADYRAAKLAASDERLGIEVIRVQIPEIRQHRAFCGKTTLSRQLPAIPTVILDGDTLITGPIDELFGDGLTLTQFSDWISCGPRYRRRIQYWAEVDMPGVREAVLMAQTRPYPAVNGGVVAYTRGTTTDDILDTWERLTYLNTDAPLTDEYSLQTVLAMDGNFGRIRILDDRYNCSPIHGIHRDDARIWHHHGRRFRRPRYAIPTVLGHYQPHLNDALDNNAGGIQDWIDVYDPRLRELSGATV